LSGKTITAINRKRLEKRNLVEYKTKQEKRQEKRKYNRKKKKIKARKHHTIKLPGIT